MPTELRSLTSLRASNSLIDTALDQRLLLYVFAAGATLACAVPSQAEVVFTPSNAVFRGLGKFDIDIDNDGTSDFTLLTEMKHYSTYSLVPDLFAYGNPPSHQIITGRVGFWGVGDALALPKNTRIGPGQRFRAFALMETPFYGGYWHVNSRCLGVRFLINGEVHYGWIGFREVRPIPVAVRLYGWAYESVPDKEILAGDTGSGTGTSAPLDSSASPTSLEILAAGQAAIDQRRKRNTPAGGH